MSCLCCKEGSESVTCGFSDSTFGNPKWIDPDGMISGGDVVGSADTLNSRVYIGVRFPTSDSIRISCRVRVADGTNNSAGMKIVDAGGYNTDLIIDSTASAATTVVVRGHGTATKTANSEYILTIEYVIAGLPSPIINWRVNGLIIDTEVITDDTLDEGSLQITAYQDAIVYSTGIECPPIGGLWGCVHCQNIRANALVLPGTTDILPFPIYEFVPPNQVNDGSATPAIPIPLAGPHKFDLTQNVGDPCSWRQEIGRSVDATDQIRQNPTIGDLFETLVSIELIITDANTWPYNLIGNLALFYGVNQSITLGAGVKGIVVLKYDHFHLREFQVGGPLVYKAYNQMSIWWDVLPGSWCTADPFAFELSTKIEYGTENTADYDVNFPPFPIVQGFKNFTSGPTANLVFQP